MVYRVVTRDFLKNQSDGWITECCRNVLGKANKRHNKRIPDLVRHFGDRVEVEISAEGMRLSGHQDTSYHASTVEFSGIDKLSVVAAANNSAKTGQSAGGTDEAIHRSSDPTQHPSSASYNIELLNIKVPRNIAPYDLDAIFQHAQNIDIRDYINRIAGKYEWIEEEKPIISCEGRHGNAEITINLGTHIASTPQSFIQQEDTVKGNNAEAKEKVLRSLVRQLKGDAQNQDHKIELLEEKTKFLQLDKDAGMERIAAIERSMTEVVAELQHNKQALAMNRAELVRVKEELVRTKQDVGKHEKFFEGSVVDFTVLCIPANPAAELRPHLTVAHESRDRFIADFRLHNLGIDDEQNSKARRTGYEAVHLGNCVVDARVPMENPQFLDEQQYTQLYGVGTAVVLRELQSYEDVLRIIDMHGSVQADRVLFTLDEGQTLLADTEECIQTFQSLIATGEHHDAFKPGGRLFGRKKRIDRQNFKLQNLSHKVRKEEREGELTVGSKQETGEVASKEFPTVPQASPHLHQASAEGQQKG